MKKIGREDRRAVRRSALAAPFLSFRDLYAWRDPVLVCDAVVEVKGVRRFQVRARNDGLYHVLPSREPEVFSVLREYLAPGDNFSDAGANIGVFIVFAARLIGREGSIVSIEMMPDTARILREHLEMISVRQASVLEKALSEHAGSMVEASAVDGRYGMASIISDRASHARRIKVETITLDDFLTGAGPIALMKMDLEGAELSALRGASDFLSNIRAIIFEQVAGETGAADFLREAGFAVTQLGGANYLAVKPTS